MTIRMNYNHTLLVSYTGYITQSIVNTFVPLLFLTFQSTYQIPIDKITLLVTINFVIQLLVDLLSTKFVDRIGYRVCIVAAHLFAASGLVGISLFPDWFSDPFIGLLTAVCLYAVGGGLIEVLISPIVEACPTERKAAAMSLLHSFYCWGCVLVVLLSTLYFSLAGIQNWRILSMLWAIIPLWNAFYFTQVPISTLEETHKTIPLRSLLSKRIFWILALLMICAGASELAMSQWASAFAESGLQVSKTLGDLAGPCMFAVLMGLSRVLYAKWSERINLPHAMLLCGFLCIGGYLIAALVPIPFVALLGCGLCGFSVGILWPGTFSLAAVKCPGGGTAMFALLALFGDVGCSIGPTLVGFISGFASNGLRTGLLVALLFPLLLLLGIGLMKRCKGE